MLRGQENRAYRNRWQRRDDLHQLLRNALGVGDVGDDEPGHVRQDGNGFSDVPARRLVEMPRIAITDLCDSRRSPGGTAET